MRHCRLGVVQGNSRRIVSLDGDVVWRGSTQFKYVLAAHIIMHFIRMWSVKYKLVVRIFNPLKPIGHYMCHQL